MLGGVSVGRVAEGGGPVSVPHTGHACCGLSPCRHQEMERGDCQHPTRQHRSLTPSQALSTKSQNHRDGAGWAPATQTETRDPEPQGVDLEAPRTTPPGVTWELRSAEQGCHHSPLAPGDEGNGWADTVPLATRD